MRAVIIEDARDIRLVERMQLEDLGIEVVAEFGNALDAIEQFPEAEIAIVDLMMAGTSGWAVLAFLLVRRPEVRRIVVTAADEASLDKLRQAGLAHAVIRKPFLMSELQEAIGA